MAIRQTASVKTDTVTTHMVRVEIERGVMPSMGNDDICIVEVVLHSDKMDANRQPVVKKIRLNYRDMTTLCSEFVVRDF